MQPNQSVLLISVLSLSLPSRSFSFFFHVKNLIHLVHPVKLHSVLFLTLSNQPENNSPTIWKQDAKTHMQIGWFTEHGLN